MIGLNHLNVVGVDVYYDDAIIGIVLIADIVNVGDTDGVFICIYFI